LGGEYSGEPGRRRSGNGFGYEDGLLWDYDVGCEAFDFDDDGDVDLVDFSGFQRIVGP
jgi:hypothetical protein